MVQLTYASLKSRYRKTFAGFFWVIINPLAMFGVQALVFSKILRIEVHDFLLFLVGGLLPWIFMVQTVQMATASLSAGASLLRAFRLEPLVLVGASVLDNFFNLVVSILVIAVPVMVIHDAPLSRLVWAPLCLLPFLIGAFALSCYTAMLNVFFRDTSFVLTFAFSILFFLTPIFYPIQFVPEHLRWLIELNPFYHLINPFKILVYSREDWDWVLPLLRSAGWACALSFGSHLYWRRRRNELYLHV
jgi:ABC-type polysaccharide/polyol phosphate export permease